LEVVTKAMYLLNFYSGSSMCPATVWIISGLRRRRKNDTKIILFRNMSRALAPELLVFMSVAPAPELLVFMSVAPAPELFFSWLRLRLQVWFLVVFTH